MLRLITTQLAVIICMCIVLSSANAQYLGPRLGMPVATGGDVLTTVQPGGLVMPSICRRLYGVDVCYDEFHQGIGHHSVDFDDRSAGDITVAAAPGFVTQADFTTGYGGYIKVFHGAGCETRYGHHSRLYVNLYGYVGRMGPLGMIGNTGNSEGSHQHFEPRCDSYGASSLISGAIDHPRLQGIKLGGLSVLAYTAGSRYPTPPESPHLAFLPSSANPVSCVSVDASIGNGELYGCQSLANRHGGGYANLAKEVDPHNPAYDIYAGETITTFFEVLAKRDVQFRIVGYRERTGQPYETRPQWVWESQPRVVSWIPYDYQIRPNGWTPDGQIVRQAHQLENATIHAALKAQGTSEVWTRWIFRVFIKLDENDNGLSDDGYQGEPEFIFSYRVKRNPDGTCSADNRCPHGQGHCEEDGDCANGLVCRRNIGAQFGKHQFTGVCVQPSSSNIVLASASATPDAGIALLDAGTHPTYAPINPVPTGLPAGQAGLPTGQAGAVTLRVGACYQESTAIDVEHRLQIGLTNLLGSVELRAENGGASRQTFMGSRDSTTPISNLSALEVEDPPGIWTVSVCASQDSSFTLVVQPVLRNVCAPGAWRCSDPFPAECSTWGNKDVYFAFDIRCRVQICYHYPYAFAFSDNHRCHYPVFGWVLSYTCPTTRVASY